MLAALFVSSCEVGLGPDGGEGQGRIAGLITDVATSQPVANAVITLRGPEGSLVVQVPNGNYLISNLVPASYTVTIAPPSGYQLAPGTSNDVPVVIVASESKTVNFQLRRVANSPEPPQARN